MQSEHRSQAPYDPLNPEHVTEPFERLAEARERCPVSEPRPGVYVMARDEDVRAALLDHGRFSSVGNFVPEESLAGDTSSPLPPSATTIDPPEHTKLRQFDSRSSTLASSWRSCSTATRTCASRRIYAASPTRASCSTDPDGSVLSRSEHLPCTTFVEGGKGNEPGQGPLWTDEIEHARDREVKRVLNRLHLSDDQAKSIELLSYSLVGGLLHGPIRRLREFADHRACHSMPTRKEEQ